MALSEYALRFTGLTHLRDTRKRPAERSPADRIQYATWWRAYPQASEAVLAAQEILGSPEPLLTCAAYGALQADNIQRYGFATPFTWYDTNGGWHGIPCATVRMYMIDGSCDVPAIQPAPVCSIEEYQKALVAFIRRLGSQETVTVYDWFRDGKFHQNPMPRPIQCRDALSGTLMANLIGMRLAASA